MEGPTADEIGLALQGVQDHIRSFLEQRGGKKCMEDRWRYDKGTGGGITCVWEAGPHDLLEKGGVNFSKISGSDLPSTAAAQLNIAPGTTFIATGVSLVIHPNNPNIPTIHMNVRYFEANGAQGEQWWFGGGIDLTPYYPQMEQVIAFHRHLKAICDECGQPYDAYKKQCDEYFTNKHRGEMRGASGIFFDTLKTPSKAKAFDFIQRCFHCLKIRLGRAFNDLYAPFIDENRGLAFDRGMREFQLIRRSRYVEFNLLYDRGTKFGLQSAGRTESILMSLPSVATWKYNWRPEPGSPEEAITNFYFQPQDWINLKISTARPPLAAAAASPPGIVSLPFLLFSAAILMMAFTP